MNNLNSIETLLAGNSYVGRGMVIGKSPDGTKACTAYFIMGRSDNSRNRIFCLKGGELFTEPFDASKVEDPSLIIYRAVRSLDNHLIVTNGDQTDTIYECLQSGIGFAQALAQRSFEPDAPHFTPRISGMLTFEKADFHYQMSILKSADQSGTNCERFTFSYPAIAGKAHLLHTYAGDGNPLPSFKGEPKAVQMENDIDVFADRLWQALDADNKISLFVRFTDIKTLSCEERIINKNQVL